MSAATVQPTPDTASSGTTIIDDRTPLVPLEVDYASRFEGWTINVRLLTRPVYEKDGYRFAAAIVEDELLQTFTIRLYAGATGGDLRHMQLLLRRVCGGMYARLPWWQLKDGRRCVTLSSVPSGGPLVTCHEPACSDYLGVHEIDAEDDPWLVHRAITLDDADHRWHVELFRVDEEREWKVELLADNECDGDCAAGLAVALRAVADEARRLNQAVRV